MMIAINKIQETVENVSHVEFKSSNECFETKYGLQFPLTSYREVTEFEVQLQQDKECRKTFVSNYVVH